MNKKEALALINKDEFLKIPAEFWKDKSIVIERLLDPPFLKILQKQI